MNRKITSDQVMKWEKEALIEALFNGNIELNDRFLKKYCGKEFRDLLLPIEEDRSYILSYVEDIEAHFNGFPPSYNSFDVWLEVYEIEFQFEGDPEEVFEDPDDWYIKEGSDLAYLNVGYGLSINFNHDELKEAINQFV